MADDSGDFGQLPPRVQRAIDAAFDAATGRVRSTRRETARPSPRKRRRLDASIAAPGGFIGDEPHVGGGFIVDDAPAGGGFLLDDASASASGGFINDLPAGGGFINDTPAAGIGGGFVVDPLAAGPSEDTATATHIALERIPGALQALDLSPDDPDVLAIFHNAASGWGAGGPGSGGVALKDWRAVCAVLVAGRPEETFLDIPPSGAASDDEPEPGDDDEGDEYMDAEESDSEFSAVPSDDEDEDYGAPTSTTRPTREAGKKGAKGKGAQTAAPTDGPFPLTARQQRESRATFALFFPDVPDERLDAQRIRIKDIVRVADVLKEKITAEEIIEMLQEFSTAPDKSMGLADFEQVLVLAQLV